MTRLLRFVAGALALTLAVVIAACGDGDADVAAVIPRSVPDGLVPPTVAEKYAFHESDLPVHETFAEAGPDSLAADGRLWELRKADRLVGVLQLTTVLPEVDLSVSRTRNSFVNQLLPSGRERFDVGDIAIWSSQVAGKTSYLWFGDGMFALLTIKPGTQDTDLDPEKALDEVLDHMVAADAWQYLFIDDDEEDLQ